MKAIVSSLHDWTLKVSPAGYTAQIAGVLILACSVAMTAQAQSPGPGSALNLDGAGGYAQAPGGVWFNGDFTVEGWVFVRSYNYWSRLFDFGNGPDTHNVYLALGAGTGGFPAMGVFTNYGQPVLHSGSPLPLGQWTHLVATLSGTTGTIYINGVNVGSGTLNLPSNIVRTNNYIGRSNYGTDGYANAIFDELRIWNVARTQGQIQANMHRSLAGNEPGLTGYWRMDETTGTRLMDASGHGQTATLFGGSTLIHSGAPMIAGAGAALDFNAATFQTASISNSPALNAYPLTVMTWFRAPGTSVGADQVRPIVIAADINAGNNNLVGSTQQLPLNQWTHLAATLSGTTATILINGNPVGSGQLLLPGNFVRTNNFIGRSLFGTDAYANAIFDEIRIWNVARSATQIQQTMNRPLTGGEAGLLAYYRMDEGTGTNTVDATGNGMTATLVNAPAWQLANEPLATFVYALGTTALLEGPGAASDSVSLAATPSWAGWTATANASWLHLNASNQGGTGSTNVVFTFDANPGATRTGTLTIADQTVTVTQAGTAYVATGPITTVVSGLAYPYGVAVDGSGDLYIGDGGHNAVSEWIPASNTVSNLVSAGLNNPAGVAVDHAGNVYIADYQNHLVKKWIAANNTVVTLVSSGLDFPAGVAIDQIGNVYIADSGHNVIKKWSIIDSNVTTLVASGLLGPSGLAVDLAGNVYIADTSNHAIKKWNAASGSVTTLVGSGLFYPNAVALDGSGNVYIADTYNFRIVKWVAANGSLTQVPGWGGTTFLGLAVDSMRSLYVSAQIDGVVKEQPYVFVDPTSKMEGTNSGTDFLSTVLPATENISGTFAPTSDQPWLTIGTVANGVVSFSFAANTSADRTAHITLFGVSIAVTQAGTITLPFLTGAKLLSNGAFQFSFTNNPAGSFTVITTTNLSLPLSQWTVAGVPTNVAPGLFQFTSGPATNEPKRFYSVRSP